MVELTIDQGLKAVVPHLAVGVLTADVSVKKDDAYISSEIEAAVSNVVNVMTLEKMANDQEIASLRVGYKALGKDPHRYRGSQEALLRRIIQGKGIYRINTVVDVNNLVSIRTKRCVGSYDLSALNGPISLRRGQDGEHYKGIGKQEVNIAGLPVFSDLSGPFGSPTSDSERAMITDLTRQVLMVVISFSGTTNLSDYLEEAARLVGIIGQVTDTRVIK